jgi:hypothetical protein
MLFLDPSRSSLHHRGGIMSWVQSQGLYYETVLKEEIPPSPSMKDADVIHTARRLLDYVVSPTKHRSAR